MEKRHSEEPHLIVAPFIERADKAAKAYVESNGEKTYEGLKKHISNSLRSSPLCSEEKRDITDIIVEEYKSKLKDI